MSWIDVDALDFTHHGFRNVEIIQMYDTVNLRTNVKSREEFEKWREVFSLKTKTCFNSYKLYSVGARKLFRQKLFCHRGVKKHKGVKKTSTGCSVSMDATIKIIHSKSDEMTREFPCFIEVKGEHNHSLCSDELKLPAATIEVFETYFEQGMKVRQALEYYLWKNTLYEDHVSQQANSAIINPSLRKIRYLYEKFMVTHQQHGRLNKKSVMDCILQYAKRHPELILKVEMIDGHPCAALVTPFMQRVHKEFREAGEVVYVDATRCVNKSNIAVIPMLCAGPAGAAPLALIFTTSQNEATLTKGFSMVKESLGAAAFFGRGSPQCFITNKWDAEKSSLKAVWPNAKQYLCVFHLLRQVWKWLVDEKQAIKKNDQKELMTAVKNLVYASTKEDFKKVKKVVKEKPILEVYPSFRRYLTALLECHKEWAIAFRSGITITGQHTNKFCEATIHIIKDVMLNRCKKFSMSQLVMLMAEIFDTYMRQRLLGIAIGRQKIKHINAGDIPLENVTPCGYCVYNVQCETDPSLKHQVDMLVGTCTTCPEDDTIAVWCKHQVGCAEYSMTVVPQVFITTCEFRMWLASLALGIEKTQDASFSKYLNKVTVMEQNTQFVITKEDRLALDCEGTVELIAEDKDPLDCGEFTLPNNLIPRNDITMIKENNKLLDEIKEIVNSVGNEETVKALDTMKKVLRTAKTPNELNNLLGSIGRETWKETGCTEKIAHQPTPVSREDPYMRRELADENRGVKRGRPNE